MTTLDEYWSRIDMALSSRLANRVLLDDISNEILCDSSMADSSEGLYAAAYCQYMHPERVDSEARRAAFLSVAQRVLERDSGHAYMWLFVGFSHFDAGDFSAATQAFNRVDKSELDADDKIKEAELRLCCTLYDLDLASTLPLVEEFVSQCLLEEEFDVFPVHLLEWVKQMCKTNDPSARTRLRLRNSIRALVIGIHQERIFDDALELLDDWVVHM